MNRTAVAGNGETAMSIQWMLYGHPKNANLQVIVGYAKLSSRASTVMTIIPLYDLRDTDYDGEVGWGEALLPWVPYVGGAVSLMQEAELMMAIGVDCHDADLVRLGQMKALATAFATADKAFRKASLMPLLSMPVSRALSVFPLDTITSYVIKKASKSAIESLLGL